MTTITDVEDAFEAAAREHPLALHVVDGDGRPVVSLAGGPSAAIGTSPMTVDSPVFLYSVTKAAVGLTAVVAAARGLLDLDAPVADVWPAFGAHGKGEATVAQALSHGAGVPGWPDGAIDVGILADLNKATARLADQPAWAEAGTPCEHVYSYGHLVGAILQHATGSRIDDLWQQTVAGPLGLDLVMSPPADAVPLTDPDGVLAALGPGRPPLLTRLLNQLEPLRDVAWVNDITPANAPLAPAVTGWASAAGLARMYAAWAGEWGRATLGLELQARSWTAHTSGQDLAMGGHYDWALGTVVDEVAFGMGGIGGCSAWHDHRSGLSVGLVTARVPRPGALDEVEAAVDGLART